MPSKKQCPISSSRDMLLEKSPISLRSRRSSAKRDSPLPNSDSPQKQAPIKIKLNKLSKSLKYAPGPDGDNGNQKTSTIVTFVNDIEQNSTDFLIKDFRKIVTIRNATTSSLSSTGDDEDDNPDHEALIMLGKYGKASKMVSDRSVSHDKAGSVTHKIGHFGFKTPSKKGQMFEKTQEILASISSPAGGQCFISKPGSILTSPKASSANKIVKKMTNTPSGNITPSRRALINSTIAAHASPSGKKAHRNILEDMNGTPEKLSCQQPSQETPLKQLTLKASEHAPPTPHGLRRRVTRNLQKFKEQEESESSVSSSVDEKFEDKVELRGTLFKQTDKDSPSRPVRTAEKLDPCNKPKIYGKEKTDLYFESHGKDSSIGDRIYTSDNTLSRNLKTPLLSPEDLKSILDKEGVQYQDDINQMLLKHRQMFDRWLLWLWQDFNLVTYGLGSKRGLLVDFHQHITKCDPTAHVLVVNGYFPSLTLKHIFTGIMIDLLDGDNFDHLRATKE
jgi:hypothetical protein